MSKPDKLKRDALILYLEGFGFRSIERILGVNNVTVMNWMRAFGDQIAELRNNDHIDIVEIDEMNTFIGSKENIDEFEFLLIGIDLNSSAVKLAQEGRKLMKSSEKNRKTNY